MNNRKNEKQFLLNEENQKYVENFIQTFWVCLKGNLNSHLETRSAHAFHLYESQFCSYKQYLNQFPDDHFMISIKIDNSYILLNLDFEMSDVWINKDAVEVQSAIMRMVEMTIKKYKEFVLGEDDSEYWVYPFEKNFLLDEETICHTYMAIEFNDYTLKFEVVAGIDDVLNLRNFTRIEVA